MTNLLSTYFDNKTGVKIFHLLQIYFYTGMLKGTKYRPIYKIKRIL